MKYVIKGADRGTGEDRTVTVDAHDEHQAALRAKELNLLVAEMKCVTPIPDYDPMPEGAAPVEELYSYPDIDRNAASLVRVSAICAGMGWACVIVAVVAGGMAVVMLSDAQRGSAAPSPAIPFLFAALISCLLWSLPLFAASAVMKMLASMGAVLRDLTVHSYQR
jgi:hypothetical protein